MSKPAKTTVTEPTIITAINPANIAEAVTVGKSLISDGMTKAQAVNVTVNDTITTGTGDNTITGNGGADTIHLSGTTSTVVQTLNGSAAIVAGSTVGVDVVYGATAGSQIDLSFFGGAGLTVADATVLTGNNNEADFVRGTYDATAHTFVYAAAGADTALVYDNGAAFEAIILVGFVADVPTGTGLIALA